MTNGARRVLVFGGGRLGAWAIPFIEDDDILIGADKGALFLVRHGFRPQLALGDFDSVSAEEREEVRRGSTLFDDCDATDKNFTDMELAFERAFDFKPRQMLLLGGFGTRMDHSLANVSLLRTALLRGVPCRIVDETNEVVLIDREGQVSFSERLPYVSLLPLTEEVHGVTLEGFQYPLHEATLTWGQSLAVSNRLAGPTGTVTIRSGLLLVIQSSD